MIFTPPVTLERAVRLWASHDVGYEEIVLIEAPRGGKEQMAAATATASVKRMLIDGKWVDADNGRTIGVINPATEDVINEVAYVGPAQPHATLQRGREAPPARALCAYPD